MKVETKLSQESSLRADSGAADRSESDTGSSRHAASADDLRAEDERGPRHSILVVDDIPANLTAIQAALSELECDLVTASSGREALRHMLERDFSLILMDVKMPGMTGIAVAEFIREREHGGGVPIIFMTAFDRDDEDIEHAYRLGAVDFLFKPVRAEILLAKVSVVLNLQRRTAQVVRQAEELRRQERLTAKATLAAERRRLQHQVLEARLARSSAHAEALTATNEQLLEARAELQRTNRELAESDRRKDEFIAMLGHELRNPLGSISAGIDLFGEIAEAAPAHKRTHQAMRRQLDHLTRLVNDLLDAARISSGAVELRKEPVAVADIVERAVEISRPSIESRGHALQTNIACENPWFLGDAVRLAQALSNVLMNAARYTSPGGRISLEVDELDGNARIRVTDNGIGMTDEVRDHAFDMFFQRRDNAGDSGLGIGLTLVKQFVELHDGQVRAASPGVGRGSTIEICIPLSEPGGEPAAPDPVFSTEVSRPLRVVVVEDNDDIRELTTELLQRWGHEVTEATSAAAGIEAIVERRPDLALVDLGLPDMEGHEVARRVHHSLGLARPKLIAVSGFSQSHDRERSAKAGFDEHLAKPVALADLRRVIESVARPRE